jgi:hypothetical protein
MFTSRAEHRLICASITRIWLTHRAHGRTGGRYAVVRFEDQIGAGSNELSSADDACAVDGERTVSSGAVATDGDDGVAS